MLHSIREHLPKCLVKVINLRLICIFVPRVDHKALWQEVKHLLLFLDQRLNLLLLEEPHSALPLEDVEADDHHRGNWDELEAEALH